jgi:hypothetical protein
VPDSALLADGTLSAVPSGESAAAETPDFRESNPFADHGAVPQPGALAGAGELNPYAPPTAIDLPPKEDFLPASARVGLPWQHETSFHSWYTTAIRVAFLPTVAFRQMRLDDDYNGAIGFAIVGALSGWVIFNLGVGALSFAFTPDREEFGMVLGGLLINLLCGGIGAVLGVAIGALVWAALFHVGLSLLDANRNGFGATLMVVAFSQGALLCALPLMVIPFVSIVPWIWLMVVLVNGIREAQQTTTAKAVLSVLTPSIVCGIAMSAAMMYRLGVGPFGNPTR